MKEQKLDLKEKLMFTSNVNPLSQNPASSACFSFSYKIYKEHSSLISKPRINRLLI